MSEFLMVVPAGWINIPHELWLGQEAAIDGWISSASFAVLSQELIIAGALPAESNVVEAHIFNGETLVVKLGC